MKETNEQLNKGNGQHIVPLISNKNEFVVKASSVFNRVIGQKEACKKLTFFVDSHSNETPFPTMLFTGSQGLGKTFMASKIAEALGRELVEINSRSIVTTKDFIEGVLFDKIVGDNPKTILLDEAHALSSEVTTLLLTLLNPNNSNKNYLAYKNWVIEYDFSKINIVLATTDAHRIFKPLINRCVEIYFHSYSNAELFQILKSYTSGIALKAPKEDISYACRGRARDAFVLAQHIKRYAVMRNVRDLLPEGWQELKNIFGIHLNGLNNQEIELLKILKGNSPISSHNLAIKMLVNEDNIESELEVRPRELGYVNSGQRGRYLTEKGHEYLKGLNEKYSA